LKKNTSENTREFLTMNNIEKNLEICTDDSMGKFIKSVYNKFGDSFRSPWTNKFFPPVEQAIYPPEIFRGMEISFNEIYAIFARMYYGEDAISSVYVWEQGDSYENGFNLALLINNGNLNILLNQKNKKN
jgi:capping protein beta